MRVGDFGVEVLPTRGEDVREIESGHVLARAGAVYTVRLRNFGPLRCVTDVRIDGKPVTAGGLVLDAYGVTTLERPVDQHEHGRFTVIAEGDERVFGPDGGRDNPDLGLIEASFRRELPSGSRDRQAPRRSFDVPSMPRMFDVPGARSIGPMHPEISAIASTAMPPARPATAAPPHLVDRAAGTGLTGHSAQEFIPASVGTLEREATVLRLRLVIGTDEAFAAPRPLPNTEDAPARPAARP